MADVLLVDDDPDVRIILGLVLDDGAHVVREAVDGHEALEALAERPPDVMVLDVMMPRLDGFGVLAAMRERGLAPATRVVVLSCRHDAADVERGLALGAAAYVAKPFEPDALVELVARLAAPPTEARPSGS